MHDPFLKSFFADRRIVEILIRDHVPEWADEIDFATLRQDPTELVARKTLQTRHPDMIWSAEAMGGGLRNSATPAWTRSWSSDWRRY